MSSNDRLRIGLLVDGPALAAWAWSMVDILRRSEYAQIVLIVRASTSGSAAEYSPGDAGRNAAGPGRRGVLDKLLDGAERWLVGKPGALPDASAMKDATELFSGIETIAMPAPGGESSEAMAQAIAAHRCDVLVQLNQFALSSDLLGSARFGVWRFEFGDRALNGDAPAGYREVMESHPVCAAVLRSIARDENYSGVLCRSFSSTQAMSLHDNANSMQWKALHFAPRKLKQLQSSGSVSFFQGMDEPVTLPVFSTWPRAGMPERGERAQLLFRKFFEKFRRKWNEVAYLKQWYLLCDLDNESSGEIGRYKALIPPKDRIWADPFVIARDGRYFIFIEEMSFAGRKGHISLIEMAADGSWKLPIKIIEEPFHLSYPFVFEFEGQWYMIPETRGHSTVSLYKCTAFPDQWTFDKHLLEDCQAVDATLTQWKGKWWLFANQVQSRGASLWDELFVYYSDSPISTQWKSHPLNPVVSDVRSARPAGRMFERDGRLYRPSQNSSGHYGYGLNICEVTMLSETDYEERIVQAITPDWSRDVIATHTYNHANGLTVIDAQLRRWKW